MIPPSPMKSHVESDAPLGNWLADSIDSATRAARRAESDARRRTIRQYLATTHGALLRDRTKRDSVLGDSLPWAELNSAFQQLGPVSAADSMRAWQVVEKDWGGTLPGRDTAPMRVLLFSFVVLHGLLLLTGACVGLLALVSRRRPVIRSVGVEVVNRSGQPASRTRLLFRAIATWGVLTPVPSVVIILADITSPTMLRFDSESASAKRGRSRPA